MSNIESHTGQTSGLPVRELTIVRLEPDRYLLVVARGEGAYRAAQLLRQSDLASSGVLLIRADVGRRVPVSGRQTVLRLFQVELEQLEGFFARVADKIGTRPHRILLRWKDTPRLPTLDKIIPLPVVAEGLSKGESEIEISDRVEGGYEISAGSGK